VKPEVIDTTKLMAKILSDGCDDYTGLYETIWALNTSHPNVKQEVKVAAAQRAISMLVDREFVTLYRTGWAGSTYEAIPSSECESIIQAPDSWEPPAQDGPGSYFCFAATKAGEAAHHAGSLGVS